jgi:hypothetical protein
MSTPDNKALDYPNLGYINRLTKTVILTMSLATLTTYLNHPYLDIFEGLKTHPYSLSL